MELGYEEKEGCFAACGLQHGGAIFDKLINFVTLVVLLYPWHIFNLVYSITCLILITKSLHCIYS